MRKALAALVAAGLVVAAAPAAHAYEPVNIVHTERVQVGPYGLTVGFSTWPVRAMQSLDFTFVPDGGIGDKSGAFWSASEERLRSGAEPRLRPMARHPRKREVWGLDIRALQDPGEWTFHFRISGPQGEAEGQLKGLRVLEQPGPPMALSWSISTLPLLGLVAFLVVAWRRTRSRVLGLE